MLQGTDEARSCQGETRAFRSWVSGAIGLPPRANELSPSSSLPLPVPLPGVLKRHSTSIVCCTWGSAVLLTHSLTHSISHPPTHSLTHSFTRLAWGSRD